VEACAVLASKVGRITSYGHPTRQLNQAQIAQCNSRSGRVALDVPPISKPIEASLSSRRKTLALPEVDKKPPVGALGPQIIEFRTTEGCRSPNRSDSVGFSYRVHAAPDGAPIATIELLQVLNDGTTRTVFVTPGTDARSAQYEQPKLVDEGAATDADWYLLRATDVKHRQSTQLLPSPYWAGRARFDIGPSFDVRRDGSLFVYSIPFSAQSVAPSGRADPM